MTNDAGDGNFEADARYVRVQIEVIAEITDADALREAALRLVREDESMDEQERAESLRAVEIDPTGAVAHFVDPIELLGDVPGVRLAEASWETEQVEYDPDSEEWELYEDEFDDED